MKKVDWVIVFVGLVFLVFWGVARIISVLDFELECGSHAENAANTADLFVVKYELGIVLRYIEDRRYINRYTKGHTSILWQSTDEDVGRWYHSLREAMQEIEKAERIANPFEQDKQIGRIRKFIRDPLRVGQQDVFIPKGISVYPHNRLYALMAAFCLGFICLGFLKNIFK